MGCGSRPGIAGGRRIERLIAAAGRAGHGSVALIGLTIAAQPVVAQGVLFVERREPTSYAGMFAGTMTDIDDDGDADYVAITRAVNGQGPQDVVLFLNDGAAIPRFTEVVLLPDAAVGNQALETNPRRATAAGDIDNDGDLDIAVRVDNDIYVFAQDPSGTNGFITISAATLTQNGAQRQISTCLLADLDNDADLDLIVSNEWVRNLGGTPPTFEASTRSLAASGLPIDLNNDGFLDILGLYDTPEFNDGTVVWARSDGASTPQFTLGATEFALETLTRDGVPTSESNTALAFEIADFDLDGDEDIVGMYADLELDDDQVDEKLFVMLNDGIPPVDPTQTSNFPSVLLASGTDLPVPAEYLRVGDVDDDGDNDIIAGGEYVTSTQISWFENLGGASVQSHPLGAFDGSAGLELLDLEGDGDLDVLALVGTNDLGNDGNSPEPPGTLVWHQQANDVENLTAGGSEPSIADAITLAAPGDVLQTDPVRFLAEPTFDLAGKSLTLRSIAGIEQPEIGNWTLADGAVLEATSNTLLLGGSITAPAGASVDLMAPAGTTIESDVSLGANATISIDNDTTLAAATPVSVSIIVDGPGAGGEEHLAYRALDADGDGDDELLLLDDEPFSGCGATAFEPFLLLDPTGGLQGAQSVTSIPAANVGTDPLIGDVADFNGDGLEDFFSNRQVVLSNGGSPPTFTVEALNSSLTNNFEPLAADIDGDERIDLVAIGQTSIQSISEVFWYRNTGGPVSTWPEAVLIPGPDVSIEVAGDFNGDRRVDLLGDRVYINQGGNPPTFAASPLNIPISLFSGARVDSETRFATAVDLDGDGDDDILPLWRVTGLSAWYESDGATPPAFTERIFGVGATAVRVTDFDADGDLDIIGGADSGQAIPQFFAALFENDGASPPRFEQRLFRPQNPVPMTSLVIGDIDGDGDDDVIVSDGYNYFCASYGNGGGYGYRGGDCPCEDDIYLLLADDPLPLALDQPNSRLETTGALTVEKGELWLDETTTVSTANGLSLETVASSLTGSGTIEGDVTNAGLIEPDSGAALTITGDLTQTIGVIRTTFQSDGLGGVEAGTIVVQQSANLDGALIIQTEQGFDPSLGDTGLDVINAQVALNGVFDVVLVSPALPGSKFLLLDYAQNPLARAGGAVGLSVQSLGESVGLSDTSSFNVAGAPTDAAVADLNNDGFDDLAFVVPSLSAPVTGPGSLVVLYADGAGGFDFGSQVITNTGANPQGIAIGDLDGVGGLDVAVTNAEDDSISLFTNDGLGLVSSFTTQPAITTALVPSLDETQRLV
ncbi:MAG: VCBS repeat-containing protein, partial [Planctomycetota bacterium]